MPDPSTEATENPAAHYTTVPIAHEELVRRLGEHAIIGGLPEAEIEWIAQHGTLRRFAKGALMSSPRFGRVEEMSIVLTGRMTQYAEAPASTMELPSRKRRRSGRGGCS